MSLIQAQVVEKYQWLTMQEFSNLVTIAEMTPGPIAVNSATFVGAQVGGVMGSLVATLGCILPSCFIVSLLAKIYVKYRNVKVMQNALGALRPVVVSMITIAGINILIASVFISGKVQFVPSNIHVTGIIWFVLAVVALRWKKMNPILVMVMCGVAELVVKSAEKLLL